MREIFRKIVPYKIRKYLKKILEKIYCMIFPKKAKHKQVYKYIFNKELNIKKPIDFNEKLHWLMIYKYGKKEANLSDKILVKNYISNLKIKDLSVPKTLCIIKEKNDIDLKKLPDKFVIKCNHWSGDVFICNNKNEFDIDSIYKRLEDIKKKSYADIWGEFHYKYIKPQIFIEEYLEDLANKNPLDYKIYCCNGKAKSILVCSEREKKLKLSEYDLNWNNMNCITDEYKSKKEIKKPKHLNRMIRIAEKISEDLPFVRVDLYEIKNKIYFGELTFSPAAGICRYYTKVGMKIHGDYIDLNLFN